MEAKMEATMETYGEMIARLRDERGWSQQALADRAGVPKRTIQDIELDKVAQPQRRTKMKLAAALEIEGDAHETREGWPTDVKVYLDIMGAFLAALPEQRRLDVMSGITRDYIYTQLIEHPDTHANGQQK
jgi:transcriptional regulator with XRE-family HTH domain